MHRYTETVTQPTCSEWGYTTYDCKYCDSSYADDYTSSIPHTYSDGVVTEPTCTEEGYTTFTCIVCGDVSKGNVVSSNAHNYTDQIVTEPTCIEPGYTTYICGVCGYSYKNDYTYSFVHDMEVVAYPTTLGGDCILECSVCGRTETVVTDVGMDVYWNEDGSNSYSAPLERHTYTIGEKLYYMVRNYDFWLSFGEKLVTVSDPSGILLTAEGTNYGYLTFAKPGVYTVTITDKYSSFLTESVTLTVTLAEDGKCLHAHLPSVTEPTCTEQGYTTHTCACGDSYIDSRTNALGHSLGEWYVTVKPTASAVGEERRDCENCEYYETHEVETLIPGDVDGSGVFDLLDVLLMQQSLAGWEVSFDSAAGDVNDDGAADLLDVLLMQQALAGWDVELK